MELAIETRLTGDGIAITQVLNTKRAAAEHVAFRGRCIAKMTNSMSF